MKLSLACAFLAVLLHYVEAENCDKLGVLVYEDLACKPKSPSDGGGCPSGFDCEEAMRPRKDHCRLRGKNYTLGEMVGYDLGCNIDCRCSDRIEGCPAFDCSEVDCDETIESSTNLDCYWKYELGKCCSDGAICPPFSESVVCEVDGQRYLEGQKFTPQGTCLDCVCIKGFNGAFTEPFCQRQSTCGVEMRNAHEVEKKCAPVYRSGADALCCPDSWACPSSSGVLVKPYPEGSAEKSCYFGKKTIKGNEKVASYFEDNESTWIIECKCVMPPLATCRKIW